MITQKSDHGHCKTNPNNSRQQCSLKIIVNGSMAKINSNNGTMAKQLIVKEVIIQFAKEESGQLSKVNSRLYTFTGRIQGLHSLESDHSPTYQEVLIS